MISNQLVENVIFCAKEQIAAIADSGHSKVICLHRPLLPTWQAILKELAKAR